jgi:error-prone DNA polymerase
LWQIELRQAVGPLFAHLAAPDVSSTLKSMNDEERLATDFRASSLTLGRHPMALRRAAASRMGGGSHLRLRHRAAASRDRDSPS